MVGMPDFNAWVRAAFWLSPYLQVSSIFNSERIGTSCWCEVSSNYGLIWVTSCAGRSCLPIEALALCCRKTAPEYSQGWQGFAKHVLRKAFIAPFSKSLKNTADRKHAKDVENILRNTPMVVTGEKEDTKQLKRGLGEKSWGSSTMHSNAGVHITATREFWW